MREQFRLYYQLTKPGIIYGNLLTSFAGFFLASAGAVHLLLLVTTLVGISLVIAAACVFNNIIDQGIDTKMQRTQKRALVTGRISKKAALLYGAALGIIGFLVLVIMVNTVTFLLGIIAMLVYVVLYGWGKRKSVHGTLIGSISGALPPVAGYTAVRGSFDSGALLLFLILTLWQMPHFYAIATYRLQEYKKAGIPVLPVVKGIFATKIQILVYAIAFLIPLVALTYFGYTGWVYLVVMLSLGIFWVWKGVWGFWAKDASTWARKMFFLSLIIITAFSIIIPVDVLIRHGILLGW